MIDMEMIDDEALSENPKAQGLGFIASPYCIEYIGTSPCLYCSNKKGTKVMCCNICNARSNYVLGLPYSNDDIPTPAEIAAVNESLDNCIRDKNRETVREAVAHLCGKVDSGLTQEDYSRMLNKEIIKLVDSGVMIIDIARRLCMSQSAISMRYKKAKGATLASQNKNNELDQLKIDLKELIENQGYSCYRAANKLGISYSKACMYSREIRQKMNRKMEYAKRKKEASV